MEVGEGVKFGKVESKKEIGQIKRVRRKLNIEGYMNMETLKKRQCPWNEIEKDEIWLKNGWYVKAFVILIDQKP